MIRNRKRLVGKFLEAIGIAATMLGLVQGIYGDMWGELYLFLGGILAFLIGRQLEKPGIHGDKEIEIRDT